MFFFRCSRSFYYFFEVMAHWYETSFLDKERWLITQTNAPYFFIKTQNIYFNLFLLSIGFSSRENALSFLYNSVFNDISTIRYFYLISKLFKITYQIQNYRNYFTLKFLKLKILSQLLSENKKIISSLLRITLFSKNYLLLKVQI